MTLRVRDLSVGFDSSPVLVDVSFEAAPGDVIVILGPSGSGKTALAMTLAGVLAPLAGGVDLDDGGGIGALPAFPERYFVGETVTEELSAGLTHPVAPTALPDVGLDPARFGTRSPWSLSVGEQRRLAIAATLARRPRLHIWDEPTVSLDPVQRGKIRDVVTAVRCGGGAFVIGGHDLEWASLPGVRLAVLHAGRLRPVSLAREVDRSLIQDLGYRFPRAWEYFGSRIPRFWKTERWSDNLEGWARDSGPPETGPRRPLTFDWGI